MEKGKVKKFRKNDLNSCWEGRRDALRYVGEVTSRDKCLRGTCGPFGVADFCVDKAIP